MDIALRRARVGVILQFLTNGMVIANLAPRYPELRRSLELSYSQFGTAVLFSGFGAIAVGLSAGMIIRRITSRVAGTSSMVLMASAALLAALAPNGIAFAAALFFVGAIDSIADVAQNVHGLRVQRRYGRTLVNSFHAMWSMGAVIGGLMGGAAAGLGIPVATHMGIVLVIIAATNVACYRLMLTGPDSSAQIATPTPKGKPFVHVTKVVWFALLGLSVIAVAGAWVEDSGFSWSANYLQDELGAGPTIASLGFVALMFMHFIGRITGDRLMDRFGQRTVVRWGGLISAVGMGMALLWPSIPLTIIGFGIAGLGVATTIPAAMHAADELPGFRPGTGLTIVSWVLRVGFMFSPPMVGLIADATSLRVGLTTVVGAGVATALFAVVMSNHSTRHQTAAPDRG